MAYYIVFLISIIFFGVVIKYRKFKFNGVIISVLLLAIMAGFRDYSIGTDVKVYALYAFANVRKYSSILDLIFHYNMDVEIGYAILAYIVGIFTDNPHFFLFIVGLLNYTLIAKAIYDNKDSISPRLAWMCFLFLFFSDTFNIMRQTIALAIVLYGMKYVREKKYKNMVIVLIIAILFHKTAIIGGIVYYLFIYLTLNTNYSLNKTMIISCITLFFTISLPYIIPRLISFGILPNVYSRYLDFNTLGFAIKPFVLRIIPIIIILIFRKELKKDNEFQFLLLMLVIDMLTYNLVTINPTFERLSLYFGYFKIYIYAKFGCEKIIINKNNRILLTTFFIFYCLLIFEYQVVLNGANEIYPYVFCI